MAMTAIPCSIVRGSPLDGVHAADAGTVRVVAVVEIPRADALEPCDLLRLLAVVWPHEMPPVGAGSRENALELKAGDDVRVIGVVVGVELRWIEDIVSVGQYDGSHLNCSCWFLLDNGISDKNHNLQKVG